MHPRGNVPEETTKAHCATQPTVKPGPSACSPDLLSIKEPLWRPLELLPFGKPVFLGRTKATRGRGEGGLATSKDTVFPQQAPQLAVPSSCGL